MTFNDYLNKINRQYITGHAREHAYRPALQQYIESLLPENVTVTNDPARQRVGSPDFILTNKKGIPFAYIETKDIGKSLDSKEYKEQFTRYKSGLDTLIITDYLEFRLYRRGTLTQTVRIAEVKGDNILPFGDMINENDEWVRRFQYMIGGLLITDGINITIKSADDLARRMAGGARLFADVIFRALETNESQFEIADGSLSKQYESFKQFLLGEITHSEFADLYAQTVTYGMFAARLHDSTLEGFSRQEAADLIPKSNPFLRKLFQYVASHDLDNRIRWVVDDIAEVFRFADVATLLKNYGRSTRQTDPMIHFYETFLAAYDPKLRDQRGVWYTPEPVVQFIVRAVDDILKTEFSLRDGLANTSKTKVKVKTDNFDKQKQEYKITEQEVHRVQLLDPACGTGTFLAETVRHIHQQFKNQAGTWNTYVGEHLIPRLHGFELLMASYAIAHIKLDMLLRETGYTLSRQNRFKIFLTNSLEEHHKDAGTLFWAQWLADEAKQADAVKRDAPVMVVIGNPPYEGESTNKGKWIMDLMKDYKQEPGGGKLKERNSKWINNDYAKFIRLGQFFVDRNREGVLAFITSNSFLDSPTFRGMRWRLLKSFDKIHIIDLHGNYNKKKTASDGSLDQNVFDITEGVSISLFIKTGLKKPETLAQVQHFDLYGKRESKYEFLQKHTLSTVPFETIEPCKPYFFFTNIDFGPESGYESWFSVDQLFQFSNIGIVTSRDEFVIDDSRTNLENRISEFLKMPSAAEAKSKFKLRENQSWKVEEVKKNAVFDAKNIQSIAYRPFDNRFIYYDKLFLERPRADIMQHFLRGENFGLVTARQCAGKWQYVFMTKSIGEFNLTGTAGRYGSGNYFPLYLYSDIAKEGLLSAQTRRPNLNEKYVEELAKQLGRRFVSEKSCESNTFCPLDVLDYVYAVLHTPAYRERYQEFLKIDFPRVPWPMNAAIFDRLVLLGGELRRLHLFEPDVVDELITSFPVSGDNLVGKISYGEGRVRFNQGQYFEGVTEVVWQFYIGGYQPAQKWLKDRLGRKLTYEEVMHYQRIIVALSRTLEVMEALDKAWSIE